ncbi:uncharacterized protein [Miscanthus floridulus]|uniref:uncharacterized protein n=1 Tax=Miscanthus floridulus TaxID=154761 RepID=UPI00345A8DE9
MDPRRVVLATAAGIGSGEEGQGELHDGGSAAGGPRDGGMRRIRLLGLGSGVDPRRIRRWADPAGSGSVEAADPVGEMPSDGGSGREERTGERRGGGRRRGVVVVVVVAGDCGGGGGGGSGGGGAALVVVTDGCGGGGGGGGGVMDNSSLQLSVRTEEQANSFVLYWFMSSIHGKHYDY